MQRKETVFGLILEIVFDKHRQKETFNKRRFEPPEKCMEKTKKPVVMAENSNWLGRKDSNLRMTDSESVALPLGDSRT